MTENGKLLKIYVGESASRHGEPLYHTIIRKIREQGLAGATTIRGIEGYGAKKQIHSTRIVSLSEDLPIVIEAVDSEQKIRSLAAALHEAFPSEILMALQDVEIIRADSVKGAD